MNQADLHRMIEQAEIRTVDQNSKMWAMLTDCAKQKKWPVNGKEQWISKEDYKDIFSAELRKEQRIAQGLSGGFVLLGLKTSKLKTREMADMFIIMEAFGAEHDIRWSEPV